MCGDGAAAFCSNDVNAASARNKLSNERSRYAQNHSDSSSSSPNEREIVGESVG